jgi:hypothetical protein
MAHTRQVSGVLREIFTGTQSAAGGNEVVDTGIRISAGQLSRVRGLLTVTSQVGLPVVTAAGSVINGLLVVTIANNVGGSSITFTLDIELTHSVQQALDRAAAAYIQVAAGTVGLLAPQTLAVTYAVGAAPTDQTLVLTDGDGGGLVLDGAALTAGAVLETRFSTAAISPVIFGRATADGGAPLLHLRKARGSHAAPGAVQANDLFGDISFWGYYNAAYNEYANIQALCYSLAGAQMYCGLEFRTTHADVRSVAWRMNTTAAGGMLIGYGTQPIVQPNTTETGCLGQTDHIWDLAYVNTVFVYDNLSLGGASVLGGADHTIVLPNSATLPAPQANQVYLGALDFGGAGGTNLACLTISSEEPVILVGAYEVDTLIPIRFNGVAYYLHATNDTPG